MMAYLLAFLIGGSIDVQPPRILAPFATEAECFRAAKELAEQHPEVKAIGKFACLRVLPDRES
jgi:hypothetical protein